MKIEDIAYSRVSEFDERWIEESRNRPNTIEVPEHRLAIDVAQHVDDVGATLVLITNISNAVIGLIAPDAFRRRVSNEYGSVLSSFVSAIHTVADPSLTAIDSSTLRDLGRPELWWCDDCGEYKDEVPCPLHRS